MNRMARRRLEVKFLRYGKQPVKHDPLKIVLLLILLLCQGAQAYPAAHEQNTNENPLRELPAANRCSVITMHIRELASERKEIAGEISSREVQLQATGNKGSATGQEDENSRRLKELLEKRATLQDMIDRQENRLDDCLQGKLVPAK